MLYEYDTQSSAQTKKLGEILAGELRGGEIICLSGDLGAGKTTFTQGLLKGLKIKGPYTSPTFAIAKEYKVKSLPREIASHPDASGFHWVNKVHKANTKYKIRDTRYSVYHIDAYRISSKDLVELGFKDFAGKENSITIIEWPEKVKKIIPTTALCINFQWLSDKERKITIS